MSEKRVTEMDPEEFDAIVESYIERETREGGEITAPLFYEVLEEIFAAEPASGSTDTVIAISTALRNGDFRGK